MDHGQLSMVADKFQWVFSEALLNTWGTDAKFCRRQRIITPFRLGLALTAPVPASLSRPSPIATVAARPLWIPPSPTRPSLTK